MAPDMHCADPNSDNDTVGVRWLSRGAVDLAFYRSHFAATPFPVDSPQRVRDAPLITVAGDSQLVLPMFDGTLGGRRPTQHYPPRPFLP